MKKKIKVLHIVSSFPRSNKDTYVRWLLEKTKKLSERGIDITVLAPSYKGIKNHSFGEVKVRRFRYFLKEFEDLTHEEGIPTKTKKLLYKLIFGFYFIAGFYNTLKLCGKEKFDIIHVHWPFPHALWAYPAAKLHKSKVVLTFYAAEVLLIKRKFKFLRGILKRIIKKADRVITFSSYIKNLLKEESKREIEIIPYGTTVEEKKFRKINNETKRILSVGRLIERKGLHYLIKSLPMIKKVVKAKLIIVGDGEEIVKLKEIAVKQRVIQDIEFLGKVSGKRLMKEYQRCDVFVLPAIIDSKGDTEGLGVVLIEALLYKKPVVASEVGGIVDVIIHNKTGLLVKEKDINDLSASLIKVLKDNNLSRKLGSQGYNYVKKKFDWDNITKRFISLYKDVLNNGKKNKS